MERFTQHMMHDRVSRIVVWSMLVCSLLCLVAGLIAFANRIPALALLLGCFSFWFMADFIAVILWLRHVRRHGGTLR